MINRNTIVVLIGLLFFSTSCTKDSPASPLQEQEKSELQKSNNRNSKVNVCHKGKIINVSVNALATHIAHGDVELIDNDGDGFVSMANNCGEPVDCDDNDADVYPGASEIPYDGIDNDCDPTTLDDDLDEDGFSNDVDCDDDDADVYPGAEEMCDDGIDNNCDGEIDENCNTECGPLNCEIESEFICNESGGGPGCKLVVLFYDNPIDLRSTLTTSACGGCLASVDIYTVEKGPIPGTVEFLLYKDGILVYSESGNAFTLNGFATDTYTLESPVALDPNATYSLNIKVTHSRTTTSASEVSITGVN